MNEDSNKVGAFIPNRPFCGSGQGRARPPGGPLQATPTFPSAQSLRPARRSGPTLFNQTRRAFTLVEVLAALLVMAIVIPVAMQGMSIASRAGSLGESKARAMRVAEQVTNNLIVTGEMAQSAANGTVTEGDIAYPWTMQTTSWPNDAMTLMTVHVTFTVQGSNYDVNVSTLFDPAASAITTTTSSGSGSTTTP